MKKKIYVGMTIVSIVFMVITMLISVGSFYSLFQEQVMEDLKTDIHILKTMDNVYDYLEKVYNPSVDKLRVTVIDSDGNVQYDSNADIDTMNNHKSRPEITEISKNGYGDDIRLSDTLKKNTFYYAEPMEDGLVLRVSKDVDSLWEFIIRILPVLILELLLIAAVCMFAARFLVRILVKPIEMLTHNLEKDEGIKTYNEIQPFIDKIHSQHKALKKSTQIRQDFTANVSHELKTPLASISGYAELIETGMAKEKDIQHFASEIHKSSIRLLSLINDIIELSELDVMDNKMEKYPISLSEEAVSCVEKLQMNASKHDITISTDLLESNCIIMANQQMLQEILYNLCDNAIRYNKEGGHVWVSVFNQGDRIFLQVRDDGIGIPSEEQDRIFERFYRVDKARSKKTGGTGLGLAIVKHIAEQHEAEISLESELGKGTTISVIFVHK